MIATDADRFAATCSIDSFVRIKRKWQTTDRAVPEMTAFRLLEQKFIAQLSHSLLALLLVFRPVFPLTFHAAVSHKLASTFLQLDVIITSFGDAAGSAKHHPISNLLPLQRSFSLNVAATTTCIEVILQPSLSLSTTSFYLSLLSLPGIFL